MTACFGIISVVNFVAVVVSAALWYGTTDSLMTKKNCWILAALVLASACDSGPQVPDAVDTTDVTATPPPTAGVDALQPEVLDDEQVPPVVPLAPENLRATRYSANAGEVFWDAPSDATSDTHYVVSLDSVELSTVDERSLFIQSLREGVAHTATVQAVDAEGNRSTVAQIAFNDQNDISPSVYEFELRIDNEQAVLDEGNKDGTTVVITVVPEGREQVELVVQPQDGSDGRGISIALGRDSLDWQEPNTSVTFTMDIGMRPLLPQTRRFNVVARSGEEEVQTAEIVLDITPTSAADVYLLIGQSNMVGSSKAGAKDISPGGADERNDRIWQLNVSPNSSSIFAGADDFANASNNSIEPRFMEAEDPLHDPRNPVVPFKGGTAIGPGLSFAKAALSATTRRIYLVPAAWGASGFCNGIRDPLAWNAGPSDNSALGGSALLERALTRLRATLQDTGGILRGILWHQGGADSNNRACADSYAQNLQLMVERIRREAAQDPRGESARGSLAPIPFIVATQSRGRDERGDYSRWSDTKQKVDAVHRTVSTVVPFSDWVNNDDLVPPAYPCGSSSCVHFGAEASRETGRRFFDALKRVWERSASD